MSSPVPNFAFFVYTASAPLYSQMCKLAKASTLSAPQRTQRRGRRRFRRIRPDFGDDAGDLGLLASHDVCRDSQRIARRSGTISAAEFDFIVCQPARQLQNPNKSGRSQRHSARIMSLKSSATYSAISSSNCWTISKHAGQQHKVLVGSSSRAVCCLLASAILYPASEQ